MMAATAVAGYHFIITHMLSFIKLLTSSDQPLTVILNHYLLYLYIDVLDQKSDQLEVFEVLADSNCNLKRKLFFKFK